MSDTGTASRRHVDVDGVRFVAPYPTSILISYWDLMKSQSFDWLEWLKPFDEAMLHRPALVIDSGVYTARQKGVVIDVRTYAKWVAAREWHGSLIGAIDVDWPANAEAVMKNTAILRAVLGAGKVWPAIHPYYSERQIEEICEMHTWCAVGSWGVGQVTGEAREFAWNKTARAGRMRHLDTVHRIAAKYGTRLHALGIGCSSSVLEPFDWASSDASLLSICDRYGSVIFWDAEARMLRQPVRGSRRADGGFFTKSVVPKLAAEGISMRRVITDDAYRHGVSMLHVGRMERHYARRNSHGFRFFVAEKAAAKLVRAYEVARQLSARDEGVR